MSFYNDMAKTASQLLKQFGQTVIIKRTTGGQFDPVLGRKWGEQVEEHTAIAILADYSLQESGLRNQSGTLIQAGDKKITMAAKGLAMVPELKDRIVANGKEYIVYNIKEVNPAGTPLIYELQVRQ